MVMTPTETAMRASRRALRALLILRDGPSGLLRLRGKGEAILAFPHPEEAAPAAVSKDLILRSTR
jgi:hypothetical protein